MASQRAQGQFERARWRLLYLAPLWTLQLVLAMLLLGLFSRRLALSVHKFHGDIEGDIPDIIFIWQSINIVMSFAVGLCTIIEIAKYLAESLTPWTMLFTNIVKTTCAAVIMVLDLVVYIQRRDQQYSLVSLVIDSSLLVSAVTTVVYAAVAKRRSSVYDNHPLPTNVKGFGFQDGLARASTRSSTEKASRSSVASSRRTAALMDPEPAISAPTETQMHSPPTQYNHERSTKFDEYMSLYGPMHRDAESESSSLRSQIQEQQRSQGSRDSATAAGRPVSRSRVTSPGSRHRSISGEQTLRPVPEEVEDLVLVGAGSRSTDGTGSDVSTASVSLMSSSPRDEFVVVQIQKKAKARPS